MLLTWVEVSKSALNKNIKTFCNLIGPKRILGVAVKGNAYGHGLVECSQIFLKAGVDYLCVNSLWEAEKLRKAKIKAPILIMGYVSLKDLQQAVGLNCDLIVYNLESLQKVGSLKEKVKVHLKIETGNHRQGIEIKDLSEFIELFKKHKNLELKGVSTHFADLEDRIDHKYASYQLNEFKKAVDFLEENGLKPEFKHCANSAATLLLPEAYFNFVRVGIGAYGLWPSEKTKISAGKMKKKIALSPALTWKTKVAQIKEVKKGDLIGYGCTYKMEKDGRIAVLPVGYYEGFSRSLSNKGFVLIQGKRAPVVGRVCMNMIMVDVTHIPKIKLEDEVVLIGRQGKEELAAEEMAELLGTINYEVVTRIGEGVERRVVD